MPTTRITVECGDTDFQKTLTESERQYIHEGMNWISKLGRECFLKDLHAKGMTLDEYRKNSKNHGTEKRYH